MKLFIIRYSKIIFTFLRLHKFFGIFEKALLNLAYLSMFSRWRSRNNKNNFNDFPSKWSYEKRYPFYKWVLEENNLISTPINYLEFGVAEGNSFKWFLGQNQHKESKFYGFDTFTGLPEDFGVYKKGTFNSNKKQPEISDPRARFFQGLFQQTLPQFLPNFINEHRNIIMMDADIYSATLFVLATMAPYLKKKDIIFFDEFAVPTHEFKAFSDFLQAFYIDLELIAAANNYYFSAFSVKNSPYNIEF